ncbi:MAG: aldolase/citrate lyase family protein [Opitutaceae bacterium]
MTGEQIREKLRRGEQVYGTHVAGWSNALVPRLLAGAPLDFAFICNEHMPLNRAETAALCQQFSSLGVSPIVRISHPDASEAAMAIDGGADGIVAPYVESVEEVRALVGAVHYRPVKGRQLRDFLAGTRQPAAATRDFLKRFNRQQYLIIGIESVAAYENLDDLISVEGVDGVFMGPHDLSVSLEAPEDWNNPALHRLIEDTIVRCRAAGIGVGVHVSPAVFPLERIRHLVSLGMNWILDGADVILALESLKQRRVALCGKVPPVADHAANSPASCINPSPPVRKKKS